MSPGVPCSHAGQAAMGGRQLLLALLSQWLIRALRKLRDSSGPLWAMSTWGCGAFLIPSSAEYLGLCFQECHSEVLSFEEYSRALLLAWEPGYGLQNSDLWELSLDLFSRDSLARHSNRNMTLGGDKHWEKKAWNVTEKRIGRERAHLIHCILC